MTGIRHQGDLADVVFLQQGVDLIRPIGLGVRHEFPLGSSCILTLEGGAGKTGSGLARPAGQEDAMGFAQAVGGTRYLFPDLRTLLARATPLRSGDVLAGV